ncbi:nitroreductase family protein [Apiospora hydei]|uniref:Nitroreductase family protein n=1 Tax=Apiospora hydei TaxID=1337664 RepID=A0ABR1WC80_9PEZI
MSPQGLVTTDQFLAAAKYRRSVYALKNTSPVPDERIEQVVQEVLSFAPSSYNTQPVRITLVLGEKHAQLFDEIIAAAQPFLTQVAGEETWKKMSGLFQGLRGAYGSVSPLLGTHHHHRRVRRGPPSAAHMFGQWSDHAHGMAHLLTWSALALEGLSGSLQHLNAMPPVEAVIKKFAGVPEEYSLKANLVFGEEAQEHPAGPPPKLPYSETLKVLK